MDALLLEERRPSSVARALCVIGDRWGFMVAREAFFKVRRFDKIQYRLGSAPIIFANRLNHFVEEGVFRKVQCQSGREESGARTDRLRMDDCPRGPRQFYSRTGTSLQDECYAVRTPRIDQVMRSGPR